MMKHVFTLVFLASWLGSASATTPGALVDAAWTAENACREDVRVLDIRSLKIDGESRSEYSQGHIPCAVHTDYVEAGWRIKKAGVPGMLPSIEQLERLVGGLGIDRATHVVIAPLGEDAKSMAAATRIYWTFKLLGQDRVSILDGGTLGYAKEDSRALQTGAVTPVAKDFDARLRPEMLPDHADVAKAAADGISLVDYRRTDEFLGITRNGKTTQPGTLTGARNLPLEWLTVDNGGNLRSPEALRELMALAEVDPDAPQIAFCNTGHNSSLGWFVLSEILGNPHVRLYDGSMAEWSRLPDRPVERRVAIVD
ncbi:sulfurtransferase [Thiocapsa marina]|uniref:3-mercaptopyruvate sulfurtransferase n=1 Tax=Thiocapsa marina 5811 TaxID=768671 RepID=F9UF36_9GAMM|nr:sulfurtransferase [Thiocapsa marina]EGV17073.1 3-mercaptopyruvate sulfurtransferase [Thiocapsa marina 5811]